MALYLVVDGSCSMALALIADKIKRRQHEYVSCRHRALWERGNYGNLVVCDAIATVLVGIRSRRTFCKPRALKPRTRAAL
jgi:hypothetical protein